MRRSAERFVRQRAVVRPLVAERANRALQAGLEVIGSADACDAFLHERAQLAGDVRALFALGAKTEVTVDVLLLLFAELPVEEKVTDALHIVTKHQVISAF